MFYTFDNATYTGSKEAIAAKIEAYLRKSKLIINTDYSCCLGPEKLSHCSNLTVFEIRELMITTAISKFKNTIIFDDKIFKDRVTLRIYLNTLPLHHRGQNVFSLAGYDYNTIAETNVDIIKNNIINWIISVVAE